MKALLLIILIPFIFCSCGVKGKPLPPENPREIGIGKPQYKGVDKELKEDKKKEESK